MMEPAVIAAVAAVYASGVARAWQAAGAGRLISRAEAGRFLAGCTVIGVAVAGPLAEAAEGSLTGHMVQHVLLLSVAAPLVASGAAVPALLWSLPERARLAARPVWARAAQSHGRRWGTWVAAALLAQTAAMWAWHLPVAYEAAARHDTFHALEHLSFVSGAALLWWAVWERRSRRGAGVVVMFAAALPAALLGAGMTLAGAPWYGWYARMSEDPLGDQQVAGVVMWGFGGAAAVVAAVALFVAWVAAVERQSPGNLGAAQEAALRG